MAKSVPSGCNVWFFPTQLSWALLVALYVWSLKRGSRNYTLYPTLTTLHLCLAWHCTERGGAESLASILVNGNYNTSVMVLSYVCSSLALAGLIGLPHLSTFISHELLRGKRTPVKMNYSLFTKHTLGFVTPIGHVLLIPLSVICLLQS